MDLESLPAFHDWYLLGYSVECESRRVVVHVDSYHDRPETQHVDVVFEGVVAHHFENVLSGNIIFDVKETSPRVVVESYAWLFDRLANYGYPDIGARWNGRDELISLLEARGSRGFEIDSSYGAWGFVLANSISLRPRPGPAERMG
jgi:hypothetical protein